jgi:hypothetical protein
MNCDRAAEFLSALHDGEKIPREAAEHVGVCEACRARLRQYAEIGVELRRMASLEQVQVEDVPARRWESGQSTAARWWQKGWETMRIPRLAFALLLAVTIVLGCSLAVVKVRAHTAGAVLMLTAKSASGHTLRCALSLENKSMDSCSSEQQGGATPGLYGFRIISRDGDRIELGVRAKEGPEVGRTVGDVDNLPETPYWLQPGGRLEINFPDSGSLTVTGELLDHMPPLLSISGNEQLDPNPNEIRFVDPVLLRGKEVACDLWGVNVFSAPKDKGVELFVPNDGRYEISLLPLQGAVEGKVDQSRVTFKLEGLPYTILTGAPVARGEKIWILHLPSDKATDEQMGGHAFAAAGIDMNPYLKAPMQK